MMGRAKMRCKSARTVHSKIRTNVRYICVLILLCMCRMSGVCLSSYYCTCVRDGMRVRTVRFKIRTNVRYTVLTLPVLILLMCPYTTIYVFILLNMCPRTTTLTTKCKSVLILLSVLMLLYMCLRTTIYLASSY